MQPEALRGRIPHARALEEFERTYPSSQRLHDLWAEQLHGAHNGVDTYARVLRLVGDTQHGDDQRDVRLHRSHDVGGGHVILGDHRQQAVARLGERRKGLQCFEGHRQAPAMSLVLMPRAGGPGGSTRTALYLRGAALRGRCSLWLGSCGLHTSVYLPR